MPFFAWMDQIKEQKPRIITHNLILYLDRNQGKHIVKITTFDVNKEEILGIEPDFEGYQKYPVYNYIDQGKRKTRMQRT
jgi:hypothetical protein